MPFSLKVVQTLNKISIFLADLPSVYSFNST